jgi:sec-independent protein translocase protein TatA
VVGDILQPTHLLFILVIALLVLGPKRLPEVGRSLGRGLRDFRSALSGDSDDRHEEALPPTATDPVQSAVQTVQPTVETPSPVVQTEPAVVHAAQPVAHTEPVIHAEPVANIEPLAPAEPTHASEAADSSEPAPASVERAS